VADLKQQLTVIDVKLAAAGSSLGLKHPTLRALVQEHAAIRQRLKAEITAVAQSVRKDRDAAKALVESLRLKMNAAKDDVGLATLEEGSIENMVRSTELKRKQYSELYRRASELETEKRILLGSIRVVSLAELPTKPFFPKRIPFLAAGLTIACLLGAAAAAAAGYDRFGKLPALGANPRLERIAGLLRAFPGRFRDRSGSSRPEPSRNA
jgi:uncharacterized protein involved in exopolysaccharide biosynthesis